MHIRADDPILIPANNGQAAIQIQGMLPDSTRERMTKCKYFLGKIPYKDVLNKSSVS